MQAVPKVGRTHLTRDIGLYKATVWLKPNRHIYTCKAALQQEKLRSTHLSAYCCYHTPNPSPIQAGTQSQPARK
jgi:hypothetical protein